MGAHKPILTESLLSFPIIFNMQWVSLFAISSVIVCSMHNRIFKSLPEHSCEHSQGCSDRSGGPMFSHYFQQTRNENLLHLNFTPQRNCKVFEHSQNMH